MLLKMPLADYLSNQHDENYLYLISLLKNGSTRHIIESMIRELLASRAISLRATQKVSVPLIVTSQLSDTTGIWRG